MLVKGIDYSLEFEKIAELLVEINPKKAYIAIPTRPPAEEWVKPATEKAINEAYQIFTEKLGAYKVEYLIGYEGNAFAYTGNVEEDLLSITSVHPMREEAVKKVISKADSDWSVVENLLEKNKIIELEYESKKYFMRKISSRIKH
jgi:wyosine [tRNA(Phe)-imidazoG37] synthetase (radical SAM superfamily)